MGMAFTGSPYRDAANSSHSCLLMEMCDAKKSLIVPSSVYTTRSGGCLAVKVEA